MKILTFGINDREIRPYKMNYVPQSVPQFCELKKRGEKPFKILVNAQHLFYYRKTLLPLIPPFCWMKRVIPCFIFNMLNRQSLKLIEDPNNKAESYWFLGRSVDVHENEEDIDPKTANAIDYLTHSAFWEGLRKRMSMSKMEMLIFMGCGIGAWEMIKNMIGMFV